MYITPRRLYNLFITFTVYKRSNIMDAEGALLSGDNLTVELSSLAWRKWGFRRY